MVTYTKKEKSIWWFLDQSLQLQKDLVLESLIIELGPQCPVHVDVRKWVANAIYRKVRYLDFKLNWLSEPTRLPNSLYVCDTLVVLTIYSKILVDVPSLAYLPSLKRLYLVSVVYKDEDSLVRLLSGCHVLEFLVVVRHERDNLTKFSVKVPSLKTLIYYNVALGAGDEYVGNMGGSLVIDSSTLRNIYIRDHSVNSCSFENSPPLYKALINVYWSLDEKFMTSLSSVMKLILILNVETVHSAF